MQDYIETLEQLGFKLSVHGDHVTWVNMFKPVKNYRIMWVEVRQNYYTFRCALDNDIRLQSREYDISALKTERFDMALDNFIETCNGIKNENSN